MYITLANQQNKINLEQLQKDLRLHLLLLLTLVMELFYQTMDIYFH